MLPLVAIVSLIAGIVASIAGFGIGSFLTPLIAITTGAGVAVAAVSVIHFFGTSLRFFISRKYIHKNVLLTFGLASAVGGLVGALLHNVLLNGALTVIFACLLIASGILGFTGLGDRIRFTGALAWIAGSLSGFFGGLVGNQGGIRAAALFGFELDQKQFVATATGAALIVDIVRMPVYLLVSGREMLALWPTILTGVIGVLIGTLLGGRLLPKIPAKLFKRLVSGLIFAIGVFILIRL